MSVTTSEKSRDLTSEDWLEDDGGGQLAIDAMQTDDSVIIKAPIAGVNPEDLEVSITDDVVTIKGERRGSQNVSREN
ncbi:Hsp20/alpha crystallin family protein, partial [Candidatus Berkelbacteria bacterium]|nr:Hsp20/alpha crystallin family protein [Candidatus Berkelbacteria bacterium]